MSDEENNPSKRQQQQGQTNFTEVSSKIGGNLCYKSPEHKTKIRK